MKHVFSSIHLAEYHFPVGVIIIFKQKSEHFDILIISNTVYGVILFFSEGLSRIRFPALRTYAIPDVDNIWAFYHELIF